MIAAGKAMLSVIEKLEPVREYFADRADAEYTTAAYAEPVANEEMRLLVAVEDAINTLESIR